MPKIDPDARVAYEEALEERAEQEAADATEAEQIRLDCERTDAYDDLHDFYDEPISDEERYTFEDDNGLDRYYEPSYPGPWWYEDHFGDDERARLPLIYRI